MGVFTRFLNCTNRTKSRNASQILTYSSLRQQVMLKTRAKHNLINDEEIQSAF